MKPGFQTKLVMRSQQETAELAKRIAPKLRSGDVLLLSGEIGAGKTHFCRALIQERLPEFGRTDDVPSPTFTLVQTYDLSDTSIWHADLYRIDQPNEVVELGLIDAFETEICLVEWPEKLGIYSPDDALEIIFNYTETERHRSIQFRSLSERWSDIASAISAHSLASKLQ